MNCPGADRILRLLDGTLPDAECRDVEAHVSGCGRCRAAVDLLREASTLPASSTLAAGNCPEPSALAAFVRGEGNAQPAIDHLSRCDRCLQLVAALQDLASFPAAASAASPAPRRSSGVTRTPRRLRRVQSLPRRHGWPVVPSLAAAAAVVLGVGLWITMRPSSVAVVKPSGGTVARPDVPVPPDPVVAEKRGDAPGVAPASDFAQAARPAATTSAVPSRSASPESPSTSEPVAANPEPTAVAQTPPAADRDRESSSPPTGPGAPRGASAPLAVGGTLGRRSDGEGGSGADSGSSQPLDSARGKPEPPSPPNGFGAPGVAPTSGTRPAPPVVARIERIEGEVVGFPVDAPGERAQVKVGQDVLSGHALSIAGVGGLAVVDYPDGTRIDLLAGSTVQFGEARRKVTLAQGRLYAVVAKQPKGQELVFVTPQAEAKIVGTRFELACAAEATRLEVDEGLVQFTRRQDNKSIPVGAEHYAVAGKGASFAAKPLSLGPNLIGDAGFEGGAREWERAKADGRAVVGGPVHSGAKALQIGGSGNELLVAQDVAASAGAAYIAGAWVRTSGFASGRANVTVVWLGDGGRRLGEAPLGSLAGTQKWTPVWARISAPAGTVRARLRLSIDSEPEGRGTAWFDDVRLQLKEEPR